MNAIVKNIDGQYHILSEYMQPLYKRTWRTENGAKRYAVKNGYTLTELPITGAAILIRSTGSIIAIVDNRSFPFRTRTGAIQYIRNRYGLPIIDYTNR